MPQESELTPEWEKHLEDTEATIRAANEALERAAAANGEEE